MRYVPSLGYRGGLEQKMTQKGKTNMNTIVHLLSTRILQLELTEIVEESQNLHIDTA